MTLPYILARRSFNFSRYASLPLMAVNAVQGVLIFVQGCLSCSVGDIRHIMLGILCLILGLSIFAMEIIHIAAFRMYLSLLFSFFGRGLFYVIIGCLTLENTSRQAELGIGLEIVIVGVLFIGMSFQGAPFDDPADECASVIHNIQHGLYVDGPSALEKGKWGGSVDASGKTVRTMGAYSGQGISNQTYQGASTSAATSIAPGGSTGGYTSSMASASASAAATAATHGFTAEKLPISHTQASSH